MTKKALNAASAPAPRTIIDVDLDGLNRGGIHATYSE